jgi:hypothetical protein
MCCELSDADLLEECIIYSNIGNINVITNVLRHYMLMIAYQSQTFFFYYL